VSTYSVTPEGESYAAAWGLAQARTAAADEERRAYLAARAYDRPRYSGNERCLSDDDVRKVRRLVLSGVPQSEVARQMGLARGTVNKIVKRKRYAEVE
jgi:DNA invertase Pin-like site-specific DNA recombinase